MPRRASVLVILAVAALLTACGPAGSADPSGSAAASASAGASASVPVAPSASESSRLTGTPSPTEATGGIPEVALEPVAEGLASPINIASTPEGWLLVNERDGRVMAVHPDRGDVEVVLDITDRVGGGGERGLLGLAVHPEWPDIRRAFVHYTNREGDTVLAELAATPGDDETAPTFDPASEQVLLRQDQPFPNHNGGQLAFGPDGYLYFGLGDGGGGGDPLEEGQNPDGLLGSILRLDVSEPGEYSIPEDNPFADGGGAPEVFLYGLRNPWRFSFDTETGLLWIADVGQGAFEEVNRVDPAADGGANLGWNVMEGGHCFADPDCATDNLTLPVVEYPRDLGCSVIGGYVYRGGAIPALHGWYVFGDYCSGLLFGIPEGAAARAPIEPPTLLETGVQVSSFGEDGDGELYLADLAGGVIYRIVAP